MSKYEDDSGRFLKYAVVGMMGLGMLGTGIVNIPKIQDAVSNGYKAYNYSNSPITKHVDEMDMSPDQYSGAIEEILFEPFEGDK